MKAMVMSVKDGRAAILAKDGTFISIRDNNYSIGQILDYEAPGSRLIRLASKHTSKLTVAAAAILLITAGISANVLSFSTVTLDVNPSLKYGLNAFDKVVSFDSFNDDGEELVSEIRSSVMGQDIDTALDVTLDALDAAEYIGRDTPVVVTVSSRVGKNEKLRERTLKEMNDWNDRLGSNNSPETSKSISANALIITSSQLKEAESRNESPGRELLNEIKAPGIQEAPDSSPEISQPVLPAGEPEASSDMEEGTDKVPALPEENVKSPETEGEAPSPSMPPEEKPGTDEGQSQEAEKSAQPPAASKPEENTEPASPAPEAGKTQASPAPNQDFLPPSEATDLPYMEPGAEPSQPPSAPEGGERQPSDQEDISPQPPEDEGRNDAPDRDSDRRPAEEASRNPGQGEGRPPR